MGAKAYGGEAEAWPDLSEPPGSLAGVSGELTGIPEGLPAVSGGLMGTIGSLTLTPEWMWEI